MLDSVLTVEIRHTQSAFDGVLARLRTLPQGRQALKRAAELLEEAIGELRKAELEERRTRWTPGEQAG